MSSSNESNSYSMGAMMIVILLYVSDVFCDFRGYDGIKCRGYSFRCLNGECIPSTSVCDGATDCSDQSDETYAICSKFGLVCPPYAFRCAYGACVDNSTICNGIKNCADNSDELLPQCLKPSAIVKKCKLYEFQCDSGQCIDEISVCDGHSDCLDGSDETITQCTNFGCPSYSVQCAYGGCIDKTKKCDDKEDCKDGSDEDIEICHKNTKEMGTKIVKQKPKHRPGWHSRADCLLPEKPLNGNYEVADCFEGDDSSKCRKIPGTTVSPNVIIEYSCNPGYVLPENINHSYCSGGSWIPEPPKCLKLCEGISSYSTNLKCYYRGREVNCGKPMKPGTELNLDCKNNYQNEKSFSTTQCLSDGTWANKFYECVPVCGLKDTINEYPWHAGLFKTEGDNLVNKCGATIIHPKAVLTAAHCICHEGTSNVENKTNIRIAVGKYWSSWSHEEPNEQKFKVIDIYIRLDYRGANGRYVQDIAILVLDKIIILKPEVMPICLDKLKSFRLDQRSNAVGTVVGWGGTTGVASEKLRVISLPVLNFHDCHEKVNSYYVTYDKFCTVSNGTNVKKGDSGGGMTFPTFIGGGEKHFIYGIVSLKPIKNVNIAAFTNVTAHVKWIEQILKEIDESWKKNIPV